MKSTTSNTSGNGLAIGKWSLLLLVVVAVSALWFWLPIDNWVLGMRQLLTALGWWSIVLFILGYAIATVLMAPGAPMSITGGLAFGLWGIPVVAAGASIGCALAFGLARFRRQRQLQQPEDLTQPANPKMQAMHDAICAHDWQVVMLMRLSPLVPFNLQNYLFGVTNIRFSRYLIASVIGMLPGTALYVYLGSLGAQQTNNQNLQWAFLLAGAILTIFATWWISRKAKQQLARYGVT